MTRNHAVLYGPELLALSIELADLPPPVSYPHRAELHSRTCGSTLALGASLNDEDRIEAIGLRVTACAVGQAAAAIFAAAARGRSSEDLNAALEAIDSWLGGNGPLPDWPRFAQLVAVQPHGGRHEAVRLPWKAALAALPKISPRG